MAWVGLRSVVELRSRLVIAAMRVRNEAGPLELIFFMLIPYDETTYLSLPSLLGLALPRHCLGNLQCSLPRPYSSAPISEQQHDAFRFQP